MGFQTYDAVQSYLGKCLMTTSNLWGTKKKEILKRERDGEKWKKNEHGHINKLAYNPRIESSDKDGPGRKLACPNYQLIIINFAN